MLRVESIPNQNTNINSDDFWWTNAGGAGTTSGVRVSPGAAMQLSIAYACDRVLSETWGQLPLLTYQRRADGPGRDRVSTVDIANLLHRQPNENMSAYDFKTLQQHQINMRGNAYAEIIFAGSGRIEALIPLHPDRITVQIMRDYSMRYLYRDPFQQKERIILSSNMFHVKGYSDNGLIGLNPVQVQRNALGATIAGRAYDARFFKNDAQTPGVVSMEGKFEESADRMQWLKDWKTRHQGGKQHEIELLEFGMTYTSTAMKNIDAQFLEGMKFRDVDIARIYKVQPHKVGILDNLPKANIEEQNIDFVNNTMKPIAVNWQQAIKKDMIIDDDIFVEALLEQLTRGNSKSQTESASKGIFGGWLNRNEVRSFNNLNPVAGLDEFLEPVNTREAGSADDSIAGSSMSNREQSLALKAAGRIVNKSVVATEKAYKKYMCGSDGPDVQAMEDWTKDFYAEHGEFVSDVMVCDRSEGDRFATGALNATIGAISAEAHGHERMVESLMAEWKSDRPIQLANLGVFNNG